MKKSTVFLYGILRNLKIEVEDGIDNIDSSIISEFARTEEFDDLLLDIRSYREYRGRFSLTQQIGPDIEDKVIVANLRRQDGIYRLRIGQMLSYNIDNRHHVRLWTYIENGKPRFSWHIFDSSRIPSQIAIDLRGSYVFKKKLSSQSSQSPPLRSHPEIQEKWKKGPKKPRVSVSGMTQTFNLHPQGGEEWVPGT